MNESSRPGSTLIVAALAAPEGRVAVEHLDGRSVVAEHRDDGVLVKPDLFQLRDDLADGFVHGRDHRVVRLEHRQHEIRIQVFVFFRHLVRRVRRLEADVEEQRLGRVAGGVVTQKFEDLVSIEMLPWQEVVFKSTVLDFVGH